MNVVAGNVKAVQAGKTQVALMNSVLIAILTIFSTISINQYQYGTFDHNISVPFLKSYIDGTLYPNDFLLAELPFFYTYFWPALGLFIRYFELSIPVVFFIGYVASLYATFTGIYLIAMELFKSRMVAYLAMFFLIFSVPTVGDTHTLESLFLTRTVVLPVLLFAIYTYLKERYMLSYLLQGIAFIIHPLSTVYVCAILFAASIGTIRHIGIGRLLMGLGILVVCASPVLIWKALYPAPSLHLFEADPRWLDLLRLRSAHHVFPFEWPIFHFVQAALFLAGFYFTWKHKPQNNRQHMVVVWGTICVVALAIAGVIFTEIYPLSVAIQFQFFRSFPFIAYIAFMYFANYFIKELAFTRNWAMLAFVALSFTGLFVGVHMAKSASAVLFILASLPAIYYFMHVRNRKAYAVIALLALLSIFAAAGYFMRGGFSIQNAHKTAWLNVQYWARENTRQHDAFIVPPHLEGFRVESDRTIYGDWKDGTQMFFNPSFGFEWIRRMEKLGYKPGVELIDSYSQLNEAQFTSVAQEARYEDNKVYMIMMNDRAPLNFPVAFQNDEYVVYLVNTGVQ
jgi:hypothetical protein